MGIEAPKLDKGTLLRFYKQRGVQQEILKSAEGREVGVRFREGGFGKRPDILQYPNDIIELVKSGVSSFHISEERWKNPLALDAALQKADLNALRKGWDLIIDIDCKILEYSKIAADLIVRAIERHNIKSVSVKFSGNHGFHIGIPFEAFPKTVHGKETAQLFPQGPKNIAVYLAEMIRDPLAGCLLKASPIKEIAQSVEKPFSELVKDGKLDPFAVLSIDTILISSRHLYRSAYSFNEKSGLVSIPIDSNRILRFSKDEAKPENVKISGGFLEAGSARQNEAKQLFIQAFDYVQGLQSEEPEQREFKASETAIPEQFFPPCMKRIFQGIRDGRKRALFVAVNFLTSVGWSHEEIEKKMREWNKTNQEPLRESSIVAQIRYHKQRKKSILPPNCSNDMYYVGIGVCHPDNLCAKIKNPVQYSMRKAGTGKKKPL
ncbi:MAG TPA: hypothetical protein VJB08_02700 [Candidatus Nanoarchaeia archaeon]|nr:hypothetical protein [Candidatus Nanoarchaeia archaeon]